MKQLVAVVLSLTAAIGLASGHVNAQDRHDRGADHAGRRDHLGARGHLTGDRE